MTRYSSYGSRNHPRISAVQIVQQESLEIQYRELLELRERVRKAEAAAKLFNARSGTSSFLLTPRRDWRAPDTTLS